MTTVRMQLLINDLKPELGYWPDLVVPSEEMARHIVDMNARSERFQVLWQHASQELRNEIETVLLAHGCL